MRIRGKFEFERIRANSNLHPYQRVRKRQHCLFFSYNSGWVLFIPDGDLVITIKFFTTLDGCWFFLIVNWSSLFGFFYNSGRVLFIPDCHMSIAVYFFTTLDECCLFLIVTWTSLFLFFTTLDGCCLFLLSPGHRCLFFLQLRMGVVCLLIVI